MVLPRITRVRSRIAIVVAVTVAVFGAAHLYGAVTYTKLHSFTVGADGYGPGVRLVEGTDGFFYGLTQNGGADGCGTAFKISADGATFVPLHDFTFDDGCVPTSLMLASSGVFYGTSAQGGGSGTGTIFSMTAGGTVTPLHVFSFPDGEIPTSPLTEGPDGFYGTTFLGGLNAAGTAFRLNADGSVDYLYHFGGDSAAGLYPSSGLLLATDGAFYGTTIAGGSSVSPAGTVYKMTVAGDIGTVEYLVNFALDGADGHAPIGGLVETVPGTFYGTTSSDQNLFGGTSVNRGTLFRLDGSTLTTLHTFSLDPTDLDGANPFGSLLFANGDLYGTTLEGGTLSGEGGTAFRYPLVTPGPLEILHVFDGLAVGDAGMNPVAGLIQGADGKLYGTTSGLALFVTYTHAGTIFSIDPGDAGPGVTLTDLTLVPSSVVSGSTSTGTVTLDSAAPAGGVSVVLSSDNAIAQVSSPVVVPEGQTSVSFPITTTAFAGNPSALVQISASYGDVTISRTLTVAPVQLAAFTVAPHPILGGLTSTAAVTLNGAAPVGGLLVTITSDKPSAAASTSVSVAAGNTTASTPITTYVVTSNTNVKLTAVGGGVSLTAPLNVKRR
jgi:uncharacterized repeat protein (TIGR03803 family)